MLNDSLRTLLQTKGVLVGRVLLGLMFVYSAIGMLFVQGPANVAMYFDSLGIPLAGIAIWLVIALKLAAGGALMAGFKVEEAAAALIIFTALTILIAHFDTSDPHLGKNLAIIGGLLYAMAYAGHNNSHHNSPQAAPRPEM